MPQPRRNVIFLPIFLLTTFIKVAVTKLTPKTTNGMLATEELWSLKVSWR